METEKPKIRDLIDKREKLEGTKLIRKIERLAISNSVLYGNFQHLLSFLQNYERDISFSFLVNRTKQKNAMLEATRLLHNFSASVLTLIDHTRNFIKELENQKLNEYYEQTKNKLIEHENVAFMKELRIYTQHNELPLTTHLFELKRKEEGNIKSELVHKQSLCLEKKRLTEWGNWSNKAKNYLSKYESYIDIQEFSSEYYKLIKEFYDELYNYVGRVFEKEIMELAEFERKVVKLYPEEFKKNQSSS